MSMLNLKSGMRALAVLGTLAAGLFPQVAEAQSYRCLPSCSAVDGRFMAIAGSNLGTLSPSELNLAISVPAGSSSFQIGFFDGDGRQTDGAGVAHWDTGTASSFEYTLFADPQANASGSSVVEMVPGSPSVLSTSMPDNGWIDFTIPTDPGAAAPSGNFFYVLKIRLTTPTVTTLNAFKVRSSALLSGLTLVPVPQPFSYIANLASLSDAAIIYPAYPGLTPTNYDGNFDFYFEIPFSQQSLSIWNGDFDRGKFDGTERDTDDLDTPGAPFRPSWSTVETVSEGASVGVGGSSGNPSDDRSPAGLGQYLLKPPSVQAQLDFPDGRVFPDFNPSGNQEWEIFTVSTDPFDPAQMDYNTDTIPPGIYRLRVSGVDMQNLNALLLPFRLICVEENGTPCPILRAFLIGDRVFDSCQGSEGGEGPGIAGVTLELVDQLGTVLGTVVTDENGLYSFDVDAGSYTVRVADSNFEAGGPLAGYISTTGVSKTETVVDDNVMSFDFGFCGQGSIGDRVWEDTNGDGVQDPGEPGLPDILVELLDGDGNILDQAFTGFDGEYEFTNVQAGTYTVRVDPGFLPEGLTPSADLDGIATPHVALVELNPGESRNDVDFGYTTSADGSIGDRVWADTDGDGVQDAGEAGLPGVTIRLRDGDGNVVDSATTDGNGNYSFTGLAEGTYTVEVDATTLPAGLVASYDLDGIATAGTATAILGADEERTDVDFGYRGSASLGDRVWYDVDADGNQDAGESGFAGVTVQLLDGGNNVIATTVTAADGLYSFTNLLAGTYTVQVDAATLPAGTVQTFDLDGTGSAHTATVTLAGGVTRTDVDFGYRGTASLGDRVWYDIDADGIQDAGENGLSGVTVQLVDGAGNVIASTVTGSNGAYSFGNLVAGTYTVRVAASTLPGEGAPTFDLDGIDTPDATLVTLAAGQTRDDVDFGYRGTAALGDRVWYDIDGNGTQDAGEVGLNGVTVELLDGDGDILLSTVTAGDGDYTFVGLLPGTYTVRVVSSTLPGGAVATFDLDGTGTPHLATATVASGQNLSTVDFGYRGTASLGDRVWFDFNNNGAQDSGEAGLSGVAVELVDGAGNVLAATATSSTGLYGFSNLLAGTYTVRVVSTTLPGGLVQTYDLDGTATANTASLALAAGETRTDVDFGYRGTLQFGDRVWFDNDGNGVQDTGEPGIPSVTIELRNSSGTLISTTITGANGNYTFYNLTPGSYTVNIVTSTLPAGSTPTYDYDGIATPHTTAVTLVSGQSRTDIDFGYRGAVSSLGDRVWLDYDADGVQDAGEIGLNGVTVQLLDASNNVIASATTAGNGNYTFPNLLAGTYKVRVVTSTLMSGAIQTYDLDGTATAHVATVTVSGGQTRTDVDFGYRVTAPGTGTIGYWKTHPQAWPVSTITIGGVVYTRDQAIVLIGTPSRGDKSIDLFKQLVASKLSVLVGNNPSCIYQTINSADAWMAIYPPGSNVGSSSAAWTQASPWHTQLDNYNNGRLCAPHRG